MLSSPDPERRQWPQLQLSIQGSWHHSWRTSEIVAGCQDLPFLVASGLGNLGFDQENDHTTDLVSDASLKFTALHWVKVCVLAFLACPRINPFGFLRLFAEGSKAGSRLWSSIERFYAAIMKVLQKLVVITTLQMCRTQLRKHMHPGPSGHVPERVSGDQGCDFSACARLM